MATCLQVTEHAAPAPDPPRSTTSAAPAPTAADGAPDPCEDAARDARQTLNLAGETLNLADDSAREAAAAARTAEDAALEAEAAADMAADDAVATAERVAEEVTHACKTCFQSARAGAAAAALYSLTISHSLMKEAWCGEHMLEWRKRMFPWRGQGYLGHLLAFDAEHQPGCRRVPLMVCRVSDCSQRAVRVPGGCRGCG